MEFIFIFLFIFCFFNSKLFSGVSLISTGVIGFGPAVESTEGQQQINYYLPTKSTSIAKSVYCTDVS